MLPVVNTPPTTLKISSEVLGEREREREMGRNSARDYFWWTLYKRLV
jgi:hypothetical protein